MGKRGRKEGGEGQGEGGEKNFFLLGFLPTAQKGKEVQVLHNSDVDVWLIRTGFAVRIKRLSGSDYNLSK